MSSVIEFTGNKMEMFINVILTVLSKCEALQGLSKFTDYWWNQYILTRKYRINNEIEVINLIGYFVIFDLLVLSLSNIHDKPKNLHDFLWLIYNRNIGLHIIYNKMGCYWNPCMYVQYWSAVYINSIYYYIPIC